MKEQDYQLLQHNYDRLKQDIDTLNATYVQLFQGYAKEVASAAALRSMVLELAATCGIPFESARCTDSYM